MFDQKSEWQLDRITELMFSDDGKVWVVKLIRGDRKEIISPISLLFSLELSISHSGSSQKSDSISDRDSFQTRLKRAAAEKANSKIRQLAQADEED